MQVVMFDETTMLFFFQTSTIRHGSRGLQALRKVSIGAFSIQARQF